MSFRMPTAPEAEPWDDLKNNEQTRIEFIRLSPVALTLG